MRLRGIIEEVSTKGGTKKNGESWTRWTAVIDINGRKTKVGTFEPHLGRALENERGNEVEVDYTPKPFTLPDGKEVETKEMNYIVDPHALDDIRAPKSEGTLEQKVDQLLEICKNLEIGIYELGNKQDEIDPDSIAL